MLRTVANSLLALTVEWFRTRAPPARGPGTVPGSARTRATGDQATEHPVPEDPIHAGLAAAEQIVRDLWPGPPPGVPEVDPSAPHDRITAVASLLEHLDPILARIVEQSVSATGRCSTRIPDLDPRAVHTLLGLSRQHLREAATDAALAAELLTELDRPPPRTPAPDSGA